MSTAPKNSSSLRNRLMAAAASFAIAGAIGFGAVTTGTAPVLADAVKVEAPQVPSFADVVSQVSPAVVSVRVKANVQPTADDGPDFFNGQDGLPDNPQLRRFFKQFPSSAIRTRIRITAPTAIIAATSRARSRRAPASSFPMMAISSPTTTWSRKGPPSRSSWTTARSSTPS